MKEILLPLRERGISFSRVGLSKEAVSEAIALDLARILEVSRLLPPVLAPLLPPPPPLLSLAPPTFG